MKITNLIPPLRRHRDKSIICLIENLDKKLFIIPNFNFEELYKKIFKIIVFLLLCTSKICDDCKCFLSIK